MHVLPLRIQNLWLAIDTVYVEQILGGREWAKLPSAPPQWPGVLAWQGRAVAVLDLGHLLEITPLAAGTVRRRTLMARVKSCLLAIPVDEIYEAQVIDDSAPSPAHATRGRIASLEIALHDTVMPLLDLRRLVSEALAPAEQGATARAAAERRA